MSLSVPPPFVALIKGGARYTPSLSRTTTASSASTESSITYIPPGAMSTASTMTLPTFEGVFPSAGRAVPRLAFRFLHVGPPRVPDIKLLSNIATLAAPETQVTTDALATAMVGVRRYAAAYKVSVPQRSVDSVTTDTSVFKAQAAWARGLHDTAIASARYLLGWIEEPSPTSKTAVNPDDAKMVQGAFEDSLLATVCMYTGFLEHAEFPPPIEAAVKDMEAGIAIAATSFDGLAVLLRVGHCAVQQVENNRLRAVEQATIVHGLLRKLANAVDAARIHQKRYERQTWDATVLLLKTRLLLFKLSVAISGLFANEIRRYRDFSQDENPKPSKAEIRSVEYGGWGDMARDAFWDVTDLMLSVAQEHGVSVLTRIQSEEDEVEASEAETDGDESAPDDEDGEQDEDEGSELEASDDEPPGLEQTLLAQALLSFMRFREVMECVWEDRSSKQFEESFDCFIQPPTHEDVEQEDGTVRMVATSERDWEGWDLLGLELCRGMTRAELAEFEEHNLDLALHKRWRARLRAEQRKRRSLSSTKREAERTESDDEDWGRVKRRKSCR
ncbi:hypothetical protein CspeluHIS016_0802470 [Cutaneotrichosporon spelunceum]|uniref:Uncharacterized protein n=1 Tax=Cutaneotrichosporon spelunceum TaxID=1672016 RepID=A0AAD3TZX0_9TREE|nr:hypothetical protein CspeluHIS016_0802470 [Cutaneotrichosporon spelunceum]